MLTQNKIMRDGSVVQFGSTDFSKYITNVPDYTGNIYAVISTYYGGTNYVYRNIEAFVSIYLI